MPSLDQLLLVALGLSCFYSGSSSRSCPPSWATLVWDVPPLEKRSSAHKGISMPEVLVWSISVLGLLLLGAFLSRKARNRWRKVREGVRAAWRVGGAHGDKDGPSQTVPSEENCTGRCGEKQDRFSIPGDCSEMGFKGSASPKHSMIPRNHARPEVPLSLSPRCHPVPSRHGRMDAPARPPSCSPG